MNLVTIFAESWPSKLKFKLTFFFFFLRGVKESLKLCYCGDRGSLGPFCPRLYWLTSLFCKDSKCFPRLQRRLFLNNQNVLGATVAYSQQIREHCFIPPWRHKIALNGMPRLNKGMVSFRGLHGSAQNWFRVPWDFVRGGWEMPSGITP